MAYKRFTDNKVGTMKKKLAIILIVLAVLLSFVGCQADGGETEEEPKNYFTEILDLPFLMRYQNDGDNWILTGNDENGMPMQTPSLHEIAENGLPYSNWAYIVFNFLPTMGTLKVTRIDFEIESKNDCTLNIRVGGRSSSDSNQTQRVNLRAGVSKKLIYDKISFTKNTEQLYIVNEPNNGEAEGFEANGGYTSNWKLKYLRIYCEEGA